MTTANEIARLLGLVTFAAGAACGKQQPATEVPAPTAAPAKQAGECLHGEGCCGGHTEGDSSCGADKDQPAAAPAVTKWTWKVEAGKLAEVNVELGAKAKMTATFATDGGEVAWNVHSHPGNEPVIHLEGRAKNGKSEFAADTAGTYSFLWKNEGTAPVELTVELHIDGEGKVHSTHP